MWPQLWRAYAERGILTLSLPSQYSEPQPHVVAYATCVDCLSTPRPADHHRPSRALGRAGPGRQG